MKPAWLRPVRMPLLYRFVLFFSWLGCKICYRHKTYGHCHFIKGDGIIAANHTSFLDPPIVAISWPEEIHFLARQTLFRNKLFGGFIRSLNAHPVSGEASDVGVFREIGKILNAGEKVLLFPEGKRSHHGDLGEIKLGTALLALKYQTKIIPTYIHGSYQAWPRKKKLPNFMGKTRCVFGTPIDTKDYASMDKKEAQKLISEEIAKRIQLLRKWLESGAVGNPP